MSTGQRAHIACNFNDDSPLDLGPCLDVIYARWPQEARMLADRGGWTHVRDPREGDAFRQFDLDFCPAHKDAAELAACAAGSARAEAVLDGGVYPCTGNHDDGFHHFAADRPDPCPAPYCKLPYSHYVAGTMHDIPFGTPTYRTRETPRND